MGIDPGKTGGIALHHYDVNEESIAYKMPQTEKDISDLIKKHSQIISKAYIEKVNSMPNQGVKSVWTFSGNYHGLRMALLCHGISFESVPPIKWQTALSCRTKGDKNITKAKAQEMFPGLKITHAIADALLIAEYGRRDVLRT